jgi:hypothetical protein
MDRLRALRGFRGQISCGIVMKLKTAANHASLAATSLLSLRIRVNRLFDLETRGSPLDGVQDR